VANGVEHARGRRFSELIDKLGIIHRDRAAVVMGHGTHLEIGIEVAIARGEADGRAGVERRW
jgi:hypothetical protein